MFLRERVPIIVVTISDAACLVALCPGGRPPPPKLSEPTSQTFTRSVCMLSWQTPPLQWGRAVRRHRQRRRLCRGRAGRLTIAAVSLFVRGGLRHARETTEMRSCPPLCRIRPCRSGLLCRRFGGQRSYFERGAERETEPPGINIDGRNGRWWWWRSVESLGTAI